MNDAQSRLERAFEVFHAANPEVYELFCKFTQEAIDAGFPTVAAAMIMHRIRWEGMLAVKRTGNPAYKIDQNLCTYYARQYMADHPQRPVFRTRRTKESTQ